MLIIFSGMDGAGKSTQIDLIKQSLLDRNFLVKVFWARGGYTRGFEGIKRALRRIFGVRLPKSGISESREKKLSNPFIARIWLSISIIDLIYFWGLYVRFQIMLKKIVICDRFIIDTLIDFKINFPNVNFEKMFLWKLLNLVCPKQDAAFLLYISPVESFKRSKLKDEPFPDNMETLEARSSFYLNKFFFPSEVYFFLNCDEDLNLIHMKIIDYLDQILKLKR